MKQIRTKASYSNQETQREKQNRALARKAAAEAIVLLENDGTLPLQPQKIALFGAGAASTIKGGTGSGEVNERHSVTIWEGLENAGFTVTTKAWLEEYITELDVKRNAFNRGFVKKTLFGNADDKINIMADSFVYPAGREISEKDIRESDTNVCIYAIARQAGECSDRVLESNTYSLDETEKRNLRKLVKAYEKVILVINVGSSVDMGILEEIPGINAVVYFCQQGMEGGNAFADIITGKESPSACLSDTWAMRYEDIPYAMEYSYLKGDDYDEKYKEDIYVGYRYFDSFGVKPRYEFGYGKTYGDFSISCTDVSKEKSTVTVTAEVTNLSEQFAGKKVVQVYVSAPSGKLVREYQALAAYGKTDVLKPGETQQLKLCFALEDLAAYDAETSKYLLEAGEYIVRLGESSRKTVPCAVVHLQETVVTEVCQAICPLQETLDTLKGDAHMHGRPDVPVLEMHSADFETVTHNYQEQQKAFPDYVEEKLRLLSTDDMLALVMGTGVTGVKNYFEVPGAAATTTSTLLDKGIVNVALCDGPAGLRLQRTSGINKKGDIKPIDAMMEFLNYMPKLLKMFMFGNPKKDTLIYQYATAFPVGTALAQTFNQNLLEEIGRAIGTEMVEYGVTFWLAPGMNIHKNPLCGRNYEYFSEDPVLSGKTAAAITRGVQSHGGCYVTLKHYAANNREHFRNRSNSIISERALREIYLKGFGIAVKEANAKAVMTSYNKLNGIYTPNSYDLCTNVLRREWGFDGVVMTDWFSTGKGLGDNGTAIKAGNDLIMPGGKEYFEVLKEALKNGSLTEANLRLCAGNVLKSVLDSNPQKEYTA